jgi:hypothetical protein
MPTEPQPPTLAEVAHRAVEICDPTGDRPLVGGLLGHLDDRDEPITAVPDVAGAVEEARMRVDPEDDDPAVRMTAAVIVYLAHRRDEMDDDREDVLRLAARAEFDGRPPPEVADWLASEGVTV